MTNNNGNADLIKYVDTEAFMLDNDDGENCISSPLLVQKHTMKDILLPISTSKICNLLFNHDVQNVHQKQRCNFTVKGH